MPSPDSKDSTSATATESPSSTNQRRQASVRTASGVAMSPAVRRAAGIPMV